MDPRKVRQLAKELAVDGQQRQEISRILHQDDYTTSFPLNGPVTYAKVILLIDIIQGSGLRLDITLPVAVSLISNEIDVTSVFPSNLKRSCLRRLRKGKDLHQKIDNLYVSSVDSLGPYCDKLGIGKKWLSDAHQQTLSSDTTICNGVILELYRHLKKHVNNSTSWTEAQRWISRLYPDVADVPLTQTLSEDWIRLQKKLSDIIRHKDKSTSLEAFYETEYKLPQSVLRSTRDEYVSDSSQSQTEEPDVFHSVYNSPVKRQLVQHIVDQDETISQQQQLIEELTKNMEERQNELMKMKEEYENILDREHDIQKDKNHLAHQLKLLQRREDNLHSHIKDLTKRFSPEKVKKQLYYRERKLEDCQKTLSEYKQELDTERARLNNMESALQAEKHKKKKEQKRVYYYKNKCKPLEGRQDEEIHQLLNEAKELKYENDHLQCQLEEVMNDQAISTFEDGRYVDAIRLVCYDFIARNVGTRHIAPLIRSVIENLTGMHIDRLPKPTVVKLMALEADILARKQAAKALLTSENAILHTDGTTKNDRHYFSFQISTEHGNYSAGLVESVGSNTQKQIDVTKDFLTELGQLISPDDVDKDQRPTEYQLLFNIKNTMTDRGPTSKGWVEGLEIWRSSILEDQVMPNLRNLSSQTIDKLASINDFYCGKHFLLGLADRTLKGLTLWEEDVVDITGPIGMEELPEFKRWNCQKPSGLRLIRTACELVGPGAKEPHGIPSLFTDVLLDDVKNWIPTFEHNRFNIVFKAASAVYHHQHHLSKLLKDINSDNKLHKAVLADLESVVSTSQVKAIGLLEKHVTSPLSVVTSRKEHILDLPRYYSRLKDFLQEMVSNPDPILNGSAVLYDDCRPVKDEIWVSLYQSQSTEEDALVEQLVSILCASFLIAVERQLCDFLSGKWSTVTEETRDQAQSVPRNNDISERDFSGLDRLLRIKSPAKLEFIQGMILYTNNKTGEALRKMSPEDLHNEFNQVVKLAKQSLETSKKKRANLKQQRLQALEEKKKKKEAQAANRLKMLERFIDGINIDGQVKDVDGIEVLLNKYDSEKRKKEALKRQLNFYKTLKLKSVRYTYFFMSSGGKEPSMETLKENLSFVISEWKAAMSSSDMSDSDARLQPGSSSSSTGFAKKTVEIPEIRMNNLKRKFLDQALDEHAKKAKKSSGNASK